MSVAVLLMDQSFYVWLMLICAVHGSNYVAFNKFPTAVKIIYSKLMFIYKDVPLVNNAFCHGSICSNS